MENIKVVYLGDPVGDEQASRSCFLLPDRWLFVLFALADDLRGLFRDGHKEKCIDASMGERQGVHRTLYKALFVALPCKSTTQTLCSLTEPES